MAGSELGDVQLGNLVLGGSYTTVITTLILVVPSRSITLRKGEMAKLNIAKGFYGLAVEFVLQNEDGSARSLASGEATTLKAWLPGSTGTTLTLGGSNEVTNADEGICTYTPVSTDFASAGVYDAEIEFVEAATSLDQTFPFTLIVGPSA